MRKPTALKEAIEDWLVHDKQVGALPVNAREIYRAGERGAAVYFARSGMVKLSEDHGAEGTTLGVVRPGELFGEEILLGDEAHRTTAVRIAKGEILRIPALLFQRVGARHPELWRGLAVMIEERRREARRHARRLVSVSTDERIVATLENLAPVCPVTTVEEQPWHVVPLTQAELAVMVGASRETTSSALNAMERRGALALRRGRILMPLAGQARAANAG